MANIILYSDVVLFLLIYLLYFVLEKLFSRRDWSVKPGFSERWSKSPKPLIGGIGFIITILSFYIFHYVVYGVFSSWFLFVSAVMAFTLGFFDDLKGLSPISKFIGQICCASVLLFGVYEIPFTGITMLDQVLSILWIVGIMNSINMLDNMDAVASVPALGILVFFAMSSLEIIPLAFPLFLFASSCIVAFLFFNWPPSKIFMGDSGSMVLGLLLAFGSFQFTWLSGNEHNSLDFWDRAGFTLLMFTIPLADTLTVTINRLMNRVSPARGGRDHTTHNFVYSGMNGKWVPVFLSVVILLQLLLWWWFSSPDHLEILGLGLPPRIGSALHPYYIPPGWVGFLFFLCYFILVFAMTRVNLSKGKYSYVK